MTAWVVLLSVGVLLALLVHGRWPPAVLFVVWAVGYHLAGWVDEATFLASYTNPALVTLVLLLLVSIALERTPLLAGLTARLLRGPPRWAVLRLTSTVALMSAFLNNTAVVGTLLGPLSRQTLIPPVARVAAAVVCGHPGWHHHIGGHVHQPGGQLAGC
jgi:hypothetical protein